MNRWLVTGAAGQLGRSALERAASHGIQAHALARAELDVADADAVVRALEQVQPDVVLNCAAFTQVDRCEAEPDAAQRANALGPETLARACRGGPLLIHVSTDYVFDGRTTTPIPEDAPAAPLGVYGWSKLEGERAIRVSGAEHLIVRSQWLFGPGPNFVRTILAAARRDPELRVVADQVGRPTWTRVLADAIFSAVACGARGILHLACDGEASWYDLARETVAQGSARGLCPVVPVRSIRTSDMPRPAVRPAHAVLALDRARSLGIDLEHWRAALATYLEREPPPPGGAPRGKEHRHA